MKREEKVGEKMIWENEEKNIKECRCWGCEHSLWIPKCSRKNQWCVKDEKELEEAKHNWTKDDFTKVQKVKQVLDSTLDRLGDNK